MEKAIGGPQARMSVSSRNSRLPVRALCLLAAIGLSLILAPVALASPSFTWTGESTITEDWSFAGNWEGDQAPAASTHIETLDLPRLTSTACTLEPAEHPCYFSANDVTGLSAESMEIDDGDDYFLAGEPLALEGGGLTAAPAGGSSGIAADFVVMPLQLTAPQRWVISNRSNSAIETNALFLGEEVNGADALTVELSDGPALVLANETEVGPLTIEGPSAGGEHIENGSVLLEDGALNSSDRQPVNLDHVFFAGSGAVGALTTDGATLDVGSDTEPAEGLEASSVKLDSASGTLFEIMGSGSTAQSDYSQLVAEGPVELAGSLLVVVGKPSEKAACPTLLRGGTYTLVSTTGKLSGAFANAPEGGPEIPISFGKSCSQLSQTMRISYKRSGATETVTGTVEAAVVQRQEEQAQEQQRAQRLDEELTKKLGEEAALREAAAKRRNEEEIAAAAAAKKHQEEEAAKQGVLAAKEASPNAVMASTSLQASASGAVTITISCPERVSSCAGTVTLRTLDAVRAGADSKAKPAILTLAAGSFTAPGGGVKRVTLHLSAKARALLARSHQLRVRATILAHNPTGGTHTGRKVVLLRAPRAKLGQR
jgi:hypothetical protein